MKEIKTFFLFFYDSSKYLHVNCGTINAKPKRKQVARNNLAYISK